MFPWPSLNGWQLSTNAASHGEEHILWTVVGAGVVGSEVVGSEVVGAAVEYTGLLVGARHTAM